MGTTLASCKARFGMRAPQANGLIKCMWAGLSEQHAISGTSFLLVVMTWILDLELCWHRQNAYQDGGSCTLDSLCRIQVSLNLYSAEIYDQRPDEPAEPIFCNFIIFYFPSS